MSQNYSSNKPLPPAVLSWDSESRRAEFVLAKPSKSSKKISQNYLDSKWLVFDQIPTAQKVILALGFNDKNLHAFEIEKIEKYLSGLKKDLDGWQSHPRGDFGRDRFGCLCLELGKGRSSHVLVRVRPAEIFDWVEALRSHFGGPLKAFMGFEDSHKKLTIDVSNLNVSLQKKSIETLAALTETLFWESPQYTQKLVKDSKEAKAGDTKKTSLIYFACSRLDKKQLDLAAQRGFVWGKAVNFVRTAAERAANDLTPARYRDEVASLCKKHKLKFSFLGESELEKRGAGGFLAVARALDGKGDNGIARIEYNPSQNKGKQKLFALVGKGLCYDTGGYNIKTGDYMYGMEKDMTGSAVALATLLSLSTLGFKHKVVAHLALCENLISPTAYKPNEVVTTAKGITIETINTDAEGRMVLSDTLFFASNEKPDLILDFATLTGSAIYALDTFRSMAFTNHDKLRGMVELAGASSGERVWVMPLGGTYERNLKSDIADIRQCKVAGKGDAIYAATFLNQFVDEKIPWIHVDLACAENPGGLGLSGATTTGFGPGLALEIIGALG